MQNNARKIALGTLVLVAACGGGADDGGLVARAGSHSFSVNDAVEMLASEPAIPADPGVVRELAELWLDYTLVALAAQEDTALATVDLESILDLQERQLKIDRFVEREVPTDTLVTDEELRAIWDTDPPRGEVNASHILLSVPLDASEAQRDSVRSALEAIRERAVRGEPFSRLAQQYSVDASASQGGSLGWFGPGDMVDRFDAAVYQLDVGEISPIVQTGFGYHIIRLDDRRDPDFDSNIDAYRARIVAERMFSADSTFLVNTVPEITVEEGAVQVTQEIGRVPRAPLNGRARNRVLVTFEGGSLDAGELWDYIQTLRTNQARQLAELPAEQIERFLRDLSQAEAIANLAEEAGIAVETAERDSLAVVARDNLKQAADAVGLRLVTPEPGETPDQSVERVVREIILEIVGGDRQAVQLNAATISLRNRFGGTVMATGIQSTVDRLIQLRGTAAPLAPPPTAPIDSTAAAADSAVGQQ